MQYVLSDKTGTLTQNIMGFVWASVGGKLYGKNVSSQFNPNLVPVNTPHSIALDVDMQRDAGVGAPPRNDSDPPSVKLNSEATEELDRFLLNLAVCNTVVPTVGPNGPVYQVNAADVAASTTRFSNWMGCVRMGAVLVESHLQSGFGACCRQSMRPGSSRYWSVGLSARQPYWQGLFGVLTVTVCRCRHLPLMRRRWCRALPTWATS